MKFSFIIENLGNTSIHHHKKIQNSVSKEMHSFLPVSDIISKIVELNENTSV